MIDIKSPQQQIYDAVFLIAHQLGYSVYDYLPADEVDYPFIYIGEYINDDTQNKSTVTGVMTQTMHVYHTVRGRRELTTMINNIKNECMKLKHTENFYVSYRRSNEQVLTEIESGEPLLHGILEIEFSFN